MHTLQGRGVPAGAVLDAREILEDPHLNQRDYFAEITEPDVGTFRYPGRPIRMSGPSATDWKRPSPRLGEHSGRILSGLLNVPDDRIAELEAQGIIGLLSTD